MTTDTHAGEPATTRSRARHRFGALVGAPLVVTALVFAAAPSASAAAAPGDLAVIAGAPSADTVAAPMGVATDAGGDVFIADTGNDVVEELTPAGAFSIVAGEYQTAGEPTPTGTAVDEPLDGPTGLAVNAQGDLFIADTGNAAVEEVTPAGTMTVVAGTPGTAGTPTPQARATSTPLGDVTGVAVDGAGDLFIADPGNAVIERVRRGKLTLSAGKLGRPGPPTPGPSKKSKLETPEGVAVDSQGDLFIADDAAAVVEEVAGGTLSIVAGDGTSSSTVTPGAATGTALGAPRSGRRRPHR